jgi:hypothetical protein
MTLAERRALLAKMSRCERTELRKKVRTLNHFAGGLLGIQLRPYQLTAANAIINSVIDRDGETFVIIFARQSGKDELLADLMLFLIARLAERGCSIVCAQPTFRPQTVNAMDRLRDRASQRPFFVQGNFRQSHGYLYRFVSARVAYFSADPAANVVGATADRLLIVNEAQDVPKNIYDQRFAPMAAAGNATRVFSGTSWTRDTLLEREKQAALQLEKSDGLQRVFIITGEGVARHNKYYAKFLKNEIKKLGRDHPLVRTQYFCENIEARSGMFTAAHRALMMDPRLLLSGQVGNGQPASGSQIENPKSSIVNPIAFLLDVAGQEEASLSSVIQTKEAFELDSNPARDAVTLRIFEVDLSTMGTLHAPTYRAIGLQQWTGLNHLTIFGKIKALAEIWNPQQIVMDATGVGEGLWAMLDKAFPTRVIPVKFTQSVKSELGYGFLAIINTGRFRDCVPCAETDRQYAACESEVLTGPARTMRWGVPEGRRDENGLLIHDDIPVTDSLTAVLDRLNWTLHTDTVIIQPPDPLLAMDANF